MRNFLRDTSGASNAEYALILAIVGAGIVLGALSLADSLSTGFTNSGSAIVRATDRFVGAAGAGGDAGASRAGGAKTPAAPAPEPGSPPESPGEAAGDDPPASPAPTDEAASPEAPGDSAGAASPDDLGAAAGVAPPAEPS